MVVHFHRHFLTWSNIHAQIMQVLIVWQLGRRRTLFAWRVEELRELKFSELEGEDPVRLSFLSVSLTFLTQREIDKYWEYRESNSVRKLGRV